MASNGSQDGGGGSGIKSSTSGFTPCGFSTPVDETRQQCPFLTNPGCGAYAAPIKNNLYATIQFI